MSESANEQLPIPSASSSSDANVRALIKRADGLPSAEVVRSGYDTSAQTENDDAVDLLTIWRVLVKHRILILSILLITSIIVTLTTFLMTPIYRAELTLQIDRETPKVVALDNTQAQDNNVLGGAAQDFYQTQYELLKSRSLEARVNAQLAQVSFRAFDPETQEANLRMQMRTWLSQIGSSIKDLFNTDSITNEADQTINNDSPKLATLDQLTITPIRNSRLVDIYYDHPDPHAAAQIANTWAESFIVLNLERRFNSSNYARQFLEEQLTETKIKLEESEKALSEFARQQGIVDVENSKALRNDELQTISSALSAAEQKRIKAELLYRQVTDNKNPQALSLILDNPVIQQLKQNKTAVEAEYQQGLQMYKPAFPAMQQLSGRIAELQSKIDQETRNIITSVKTNYEILRDEENSLRQKMETLKTELMDLQNRTIHRYNILKREVDTNRQLYDALLQQHKELGIFSNVQTNNISIVDRAEPVQNPHKPKIYINLLIGAILGLLIGIALAFLFEYLDDTLKTSEDIEHSLHLPVIGLIPKIKRKKDEINKCDLALTMQLDPRSMFAEAYRSVRTALQFSTTEGLPRILHITSANASEGKSTSALSLAIQFAQAGNKVLLIDADLRNPSLHKSLDIDMSTTKGLTSYLVGEANTTEISKPSVISNLFVISVGYLPPNPAELLSGPRMLELLSLATEKFDQIIIDSAPVLGLADALILSNLSAGTLLVVESNKTRIGTALNAIKRLRSARGNILGVLITKIEQHTGQYGYHADYYYYYGDTPKRLINS